MPVDPHSEAIVHLTEAYAAQGKNFAALMRTDPVAANALIEEVAAAPDDDDDEPMDDDDEPTDDELDAMPDSLPAGTLDLDNPEDDDE